MKVLAAILTLFLLPAAVIAKDNNNTIEFSYACPGPVTTITFIVTDETEQDNGFIAVEIKQDGEIVLEEAPFPTEEVDGQFISVIELFLDPGSYTLKWDDEEQIDRSYDKVDFEVPECEEEEPPAPPPAPRPTPTPPRATLPPTDTE